MFFCRFSSGLKLLIGTVHCQPKHDNVIIDYIASQSAKAHNNNVRAFDLNHNPESSFSGRQEVKECSNPIFGSCIVPIPTLKAGHRVNVMTKHLTGQPCIVWKDQRLLPGMPISSRHLKTWTPDELVSLSCPRNQMQTCLPIMCYRCGKTHLSRIYVTVCIFIIGIYML